MQNSTTEKRTFFSPSRLKSAVIYLLSVFILSSVFAILICGFATSSKGLGFQTGVDAFLKPSEIELTDEITWAKVIANGYGNFFGYLLAFIGIVLWQRHDFIMDYQSLCENKKKYSILIPCLGIAFMLIAYGVDKLFGLWVGDSENQNTIVTILYSDAKIPMIIATVLFAPVVEEMIYRKTIFHCLRRYSVVSAYLASIILFVLPHMLSTQASVGVWILTCIPYIISATLLCVIYHKSGYNIYASICAHMLNNLLAVILVYAQIGK